MANRPISGLAPLYIEGVMHGLCGRLGLSSAERLTHQSVTALYLTYGGG